MRILLVRVAADTRYMQAMYKVVRMEPLSLEYLGAAVKADHEVKLFDMRVQGGWAGLRKVLETFKPQVVGTGGDTCESSACKRVLTLAKELDPECLTVVGGIHATSLPEDYLHPDIDLVVINEGVFAFREIVAAFERGASFHDIPGLGVNQEGAQHRTPKRPLSELDRLPFPDRRLTADARSRYGFSLWGKHLALMRYTQGCVGRCDFCPSWTQTDGRYLRRSVDSMLAELETIQEPYIYFVCEESLLDTPLSLALAKAIQEQGLGKRFGMPLRADTIAAKPQVIEAWAAAGLTDTIVGIEQANDDHLQDREKTTTVQDNRDALRILKANHVDCTGSMFFRPDFTREQFTELVNFTLELGIDCPQYFVLTPIPGTKLYDKVRGQLVEHDFDLWDFNHAVTPTKLPLQQFYEEYMYAYQTHLSPGVVEFYQRKLAGMSPQEMEAEMDGLMGFREVFGTLHTDHKEYAGPSA
ncbi:MAG TPA: cobalamin-dependent protein [Myxococcota bacterium]|nr:cobalamin-dependent protein [Myxococcota bacterium]HRY97133.1 cobalamin-dependent protein [Myxococcota bacterium]